MKRCLCILLLLWVTAYQVQAQFLDSLQSALNHKGKFTLSLDSYSSFIDNDDADISGILVGVCFNDKITIGGGFDFLLSYVSRNEMIEGTEIKKQINYSFICYYVQYQFKLTKHWEIDIPLKIGLGSSDYTYLLQGKSVTADSRFVMPVEPAIEIDYDFNKYWGLYVQAGFRWMMVANNALQADFNSPTYDFGVFIHPSEIYKALFPKTKLAHYLEED